MTDPQLALIIDKSAAYINFQTERVLDRWGVNKSETRMVNSLTPAGQSLFGGVPTSIVHLEDAEAVKTLVTNAEVDKLVTDFPSGLIVTTSVARNSTRKLENLFSDAGGELYIPPGKGDDPIAVKLLSELSVTKEVRETLLSYVGEDYDSLIPIVDSLSSIPRRHHGRITSEDIYVRFPQPKGAVAPWLIEKPLLAGNMSEAIDLFRRIHQHSHFLVVLTILKNKFQMAYRIAVMTNDSPKITDDAIAAALGLNSSGQVRFARRTAREYGVMKLQKAVLTIAETESKVKGMSAAPSVATMEAMLVSLCLTLRKGAR